jgi:dihydrofolate reductase
MREVVADHLLSLDGYFAGAKDEIDWFKFDEESLEWSRNLLRAAQSIVLGRRTYELFMQYWPTPQAKKDEPVISQLLTALPKFVFSRTLESPTWENSQVIRSSPAEAVREMKHGDGGHILLLGSANILSALWKEQLVDELNIRIQPIVLGKGRPLFPEPETRRILTLKECRMFQSGVAALRYAVGRV